MPKDTSIHKILVIGSGPIVIGQGCEFDYSGVQACKALKEEGYRVILVNSNPATIMTDPEFADRTYIEPITPEVVEKIIIREQPDALLPTLGGQTALNTSMALFKSGVLDQHGVRMIGANADAIDKGEDRQRFKDAMLRIGLDLPRSGTAHTLQEARIVAEHIATMPLIIRPAFTLGGQGGGIAYNREEFEEIISRGLDLSPVSEVLIEESLLGWKEFEMEVMRDRNDNCVVVCSIENLDPMGVHTGDSITVAPIQTLTDREYQIMRDASFACIREIGVETGGSNIQFATDPKTGRMIIIEMNPRVSRSSALASKATGFPIAKIAAKLAVGYTLDELPNDITRETPASFEPTIDYVVTKVPRFTFEKFPTANPVLTTSMKSVGEAMAIGRTFKESLQKCLRSLETGRWGFGFDRKDPLNPTRDEITRKLQIPNAERIFWLQTAFTNGWTLDEVHAATQIDPWFLGHLQQIAEEGGRMGFQPVKEDGLPACPSSKHPSNLSPATFLPFCPGIPIDKSRRHLPHWEQDGCTYFVTFRLRDSLPEAQLVQWRDELVVWHQHHPLPWDYQTFREYELHFREGPEKWLDQGHGECLLAAPANRATVANALRHFDGQRYVLDSFVVMPNHVHVLVKPLAGNLLSEILHSWKSFTAHALNKALGRDGHLWMEESYDRIVRDWENLVDCRDYIEHNPAKLPQGSFELGMLKALEMPVWRTGVPPVRADSRPGCRDSAGQAGRLSSLTSGTDVLRHWKKLGFSDRQIALAQGVHEDDVRAARKAAGIIPTYRLVDTCAAEFEAATPYFYSTYGDENEARQSAKKKIIILGGGPNRIGQGIEFDYCCVHAAFALRELGYETIMVNSNPETVSTDYDTSDKLFFEPLTLEDVLNICDQEQPHGVIVQFGGQTPLNLAADLERHGVPIIGTSPKSIEQAEDRKFFSALLDKLHLKQAEAGTATNEAEALVVANRIGYPVLVRPSFVLGGRAMMIVYSDAELSRYMRAAVTASPERPVLVDRFLDNATEVDVDCISDGETSVIGAIMEHIEQAGIHSGDSACVIPSFSLTDSIKAEITRAAIDLARELKVKGLMNIQFAVKDEQLYVIEVNPRASRTVPFVAKATGVSLAKLAAKVMVGAKLKDLGFTETIIPAHFSVKEAVFPWNRFPGIDIVLGPEMKSTGEVMGIDPDWGMAYAKSQMSAFNPLPTSGNVFLSVAELDKPRIVAVARDLVALGFKIFATAGTHARLVAEGIPCHCLFKLHEQARPNVIDMMKNREIHFVVNTPSGHEAREDEVKIRATAIARKISHTTNLAAAVASVKAIRSLKERELTVRSIQEYHA
ncbi:MAG: carbamoyl-phosphate synthase large subunit [Verrucomicrobia bacterium]|nr:carbamoyl-phosphate synthase large subunit [Verrucomicrobiota bacterium]